MRFKFFLYGLPLLCFVLSAQIFTMQPQEQLFLGACIQCNKFNQHVNNLPCEHPLCAACVDQVADDNINLGLPGICQSCGLIYLSGDVFNANGHQMNKQLFTPALEVLSIKEHIQTVAGGILVAGCVGGFCLVMSPKMRASCVFGSMASVPLLGAYYKFKKMDKVLSSARALAPQAPTLSLIMEKRIKAFKTKFGIYALASALVIPATVIIEKVVAKNDKNFLNNHGIPFIFYGLAGTALCEMALTSWGAKYESIPKLK